MTSKITQQTADAAMFVYETFATDSAEVAAELGVSVEVARDRLARAEAAGLICSDVQEGRTDGSLNNRGDVTGTHNVWQGWAISIDEHSEEEAREIVNSALGIDTDGLTLAEAQEEAREMIAEAKAEAAAEYEAPLSKRCSKCHVSQAPTAFARSASSKDGLYSQCKSCEADGRKAKKAVKEALHHGTPDQIVSALKARDHAEGKHSSHTEAGCSRCAEALGRGDYPEHFDPTPYPTATAIANGADPVQALNAAPAYGDGRNLRDAPAFGSQVPVTIEAIGHTGRAWRIEVGNRVLDLRTSSPRRYLVITLNGTIIKRTDNQRTALNEQRKRNLTTGATPAMTIDTAASAILRAGELVTSFTYQQVRGA